MTNGNLGSQTPRIAYCAFALGVLLFSLGASSFSLRPSSPSKNATSDSISSISTVSASFLAYHANSQEGKFVNTTSHVNLQPLGTGDPEVPCTTQGTWGEPSQPACGNYYQAAYGYSTFGSHSTGVTSVQVTASFVGTSPTSLPSNTWIAGGLSVYGVSTNSSYDVGYNIYAYVDNFGTLGVATYVLSACEFHGNPSCPNNFQSIYATSTTISSLIGGSPNYATDSITLYFDWCTSSGCQSYWSSSCGGVGPDGLFIADAKDPNISSSYYTFADICPSRYIPSSPYFYFGMLGVNPENGPFYYAYGYEEGFTSNVNPITNANFVQLSNPLEASTSVPHVETLGANLPSPGGSNPWWHINWWWGGSSSYADAMVPIQVATIDNLAAAEVNAQTLTASGSGRTVCAKVTNFASLKTLADSVHEGSLTLQNFIQGHPVDDHSGYWNIVSTSSCPYITWAYANGDQNGGDETQLW